MRESQLGTGMPEIINKTTSKAAILGRDFPGTRFEVLAHPGDIVSMGQPVLRDRRKPEILFTAPVAGTVSKLSRGPKRSIVSFQIESAGESLATAFDVKKNADAAELRGLMLRSGLWTALRQRPFGIIPDPARQPSALLVTAIDTEPLAPDPAQIIAERQEEFVAGAEALGDMVDAPVHICKSSGSDLPDMKSPKVNIAEFAGSHPAGLPSMHIRRLCPIGFSSDTPWYIGYQDVIALGHLLKTRHIAPDKIVSVGGPTLSDRQLHRVTSGGYTEELVDRASRGKVTGVISGSPLNGHEARGDEAFLGQRHNQITVFSLDKVQKPWWQTLSLFEVKPGAHRSPLIPTNDLNDASLPGILTVPLMRALLVGDTERARDLGALELVEEDVAMWGYLCSSKTDYASLLRRVLNQLQKEQMAVAA